MDQRSVRVVVGEGRTTRKGLLRFVLEGDGFLVVGDAQTPADLAPVLGAEQPDVVVLDDTIGVTAVQLTRQIVPSAKIVVVWPEAVVPIGGATRVEPAEVLGTLSATVARIVGVTGPGFETITRPDWIEKVRKDPATLREMLAKGGGMPKRPSVTELQRRGQRLHPSTGMGVSASARVGEPSVTDDAPAPLVILPPGSIAGDADSGGTPAGGIDPVIVLPPGDEGSSDDQIGVAAGAAAAASTPDEVVWNRRLGMIALGGAAVAGALMIALSFGGGPGRTVIVAEPFLPPIVAPQPPQISPPSAGGETPGADGGGHTTRPDQPPTRSGSPPAAPTADTTTGGGGGGTSTTGGGGGTSTNTGGGSSGTTSRPTSAPGGSALHNPHGGPPGLIGATHGALRSARAHAVNAARAHPHKA